MVALSAMSYFDRTIMSIAGPTIMKELHISETSMGWVYSAFLFPYAILMGPGGVLADRIGPRLVLTLSGIANTVLTGVTGLCGSLFGFLSVRLIMGAFSAPLYPACACMTRNWFPATRVARVQGMVQGGSAIGGAFSPVVFAAWIAALGWRVSFWLAAILTGALYFVWYLRARDYPQDHQPQSHSLVNREDGGWVEILRGRNMLLLTLSYFCLNYFEYIFFYWIYYYFGEIRHLGKAESAAYVTVLMLTMVVMTPLGGLTSDWLVARHGLRSGRRVVPLVGMTLSAGLLFAGASGMGTLATVAFLSLALGFSASAEGPFWASAIDLGGRRAGSACGILNTGGNAGGILAPILTPLFAGKFGWAGGLYFGSVVVLLGVLAWFFIDASAQAERQPAGGLATTAL
jgi:ACS family glucarate transporter-like MFS transporter